MASSKRRKTSFTKADAKECFAKAASLKQYGDCLGKKVRSRKGKRKHVHGKRRK